MGVGGLLQILHGEAFEATLQQLAHQRLGVDTSCLEHKGACQDSSGAISAATVSKNGEISRDSLVYLSVVHRLIKAAKEHKIELIFVLDGQLLPAKVHVQENRDWERVLAQQGVSANPSLGRKAISVEPEMKGELVKLLMAEQIKYYMAPYEADSLLAYLEREQIIDAIITEDSDLLEGGKIHFDSIEMDNVLGIYTAERGDGWKRVPRRSETQVVLLKWHQKLRTDKTVPLRKPEPLISFQSCSFANFQLMAILMGGDYLMRLPRVGPATIHREMVKVSGDLSKNLLQKQVLCLLSTLVKLSPEVPVDYGRHFSAACVAFRYALVYDLRSKKEVYFNDPPQTLSDLEKSFLGLFYCGRTASRPQWLPTMWEEREKELGQESATSARGQSI
ncbi:PIN domain-like protein [Mycena vulgaris]|nr:PIN domain-like protein [Mycena vulgaris]